MTVEKEANKIVWWILGAIFSIAMLFLNSSVNSLNADNKDGKNKISALETKVASLEAINATYNQRLDRIENKIDFLIQLRSEPAPK